MDKTYPCLHPNPGWKDSAKRETPYKSNSEVKDLLGKHCILELYGCHQGKLNDEAFVRTTITAAAKYAGATLLNLITHHFEPQGVTGLALLAESHISIHTWPENQYAAVDVFTCGDHTMPDKACEFVKNELLAKEYSLKILEREAPKNIRSSIRN